jgi:hypothetical protein
MGSQVRRGRLSGVDLPAADQQEQVHPLLALQVARPGHERL